MPEIDAAVVRGPNEHTIETVDLDEPKSGEVLVDVRATGVCHTDYHAYRNDDTSFPIVLGHEGAGVVKRVGDTVSAVEPGDQVILWVLPSCGECEYCRSGRSYLCQIRRETRGYMMDGTRRLSQNGEPLNHFYAQSSLAEMAVVPERQVVPIDDDVSPKVAALLGCGVSTGLGAVLNVASVDSGDTVAVIGCGGVGAAAIEAAGAVSAGTIIAVDVDRDTLARMEALGATHVVDASATDPVETIHNLTGGVDNAFECIGAPETVRQSVNILRPGGTAVVSGTSDSIPLDLDLGTFTRGIEIVGNIVGFTRPHVDIPKYVTMYQNGDLNLDALLTGHYDLDDLDEAFAALEAGEGIRNVVQFDSSM